MTSYIAACEQARERDAELWARVKKGQEVWGVYQVIELDEQGNTAQVIDRIEFDEPDPDSLGPGFFVQVAMVIPWPEKLPYT